MTDGSISSTESTLNRVRLNKNLQCILRELCEAAAYLWKRFSVHDKTVKRLLSHVQQNAVKVDYPPDISKYVVFENGVLNLDTLELEDFTPQKFFTSMIHANWLAENKACPEYEKCCGQAFL